VNLYSVIFASGLWKLRTPAINDGLDLYQLCQTWRHTSFAWASNI